MVTRMFIETTFEHSESISSTIHGIHFKSLFVWSLKNMSLTPDYWKPTVLAPLHNNNPVTVNEISMPLFK